MTISSKTTPTFTIHFSRRMMIGLAALLCAPWAVVGLVALRHAGSDQGIRFLPGASAAAPGGLVAGHLPEPSDPSSTPTVEQSKPGPWGTMQIVPMVLELPDEYAFLPKTLETPDRWIFTGQTRDTAIAFMQSCGFTSRQMDQVRAAKWTENAIESTVEPPDELILSLDAGTRSKLYGKLALDKANGSVIDPYWFRSDWIDFRMRGSELSDSSLGLIQKLLYAGPNNVMLLNDIKPALRTLSDPAEQKRFVKVVTRKRSLMARIIVDPRTDVRALAEYWGADGRQKDLVPILESLKINVESGIENPSMINIVTLLPRFARERLYSHSYATQNLSNSHLEDCFWTAFNFFSRYPDNQTNDMNYLARVLERDYYKISEPTRLGDLILLTDASGEAIHAANYIADDIVFTKNGMNFTQPWILSHLQDMIDTYRLRAETLQVVYFRRR